MTNPELDNLLEFIRISRGFDFSGYKRSTLERRLLKRLQQVGIKSYPEYIEYLEVHPEEFTQLFNSILINVTSFFRDTATWEFLEHEILPPLIENKHPQEPIRVWSAGCASGEETYGITMLLAEQLGLERFKERVKIYATDLDEEALVAARQASYPEKDLESMPSAYLEKYFERSSGRYAFNKDLRRSVIFGRHDLIQDAPISRIDLLLCRNVLMYFNAETQARILARLNYALNEDGYLFLGKAEMLLTHANLFTPVSLRNRIFRKVSSVHPRGRLVGRPEGGNGDIHEPLNNHALLLERLYDTAFRTGPVAQIVLNAEGLLLLANEKACSLFHLEARDLGRPFQDLEISYRPVELRSSIERAYAGGKPVILREIASLLNNVDCYLDVIITPLSNGSGGWNGISIAFQDVTDHKRLQGQLEQANQALETAMEELQATNEELETTNEELQSTIEELETTNEELQATNEELETMNEELQSTNEELETMNDEVIRRSEELNLANAFLTSILSGLRSAVIVLDNDLKVLMWNQKSEELWGLRSNEAIGHNLFALDFGLPVDLLKAPVRQVLSGETEHLNTEMTVTNRVGRQVHILITVTAMRSDQKEIRGAIVLVDQDGNIGAG